MELSDGETYPTYNGWLMYEYSGDSGPDQAEGEGVSSYGGTWYVLSPSGTRSPRGPPARAGERLLEDQRLLTRQPGASDCTPDRWRETV